MSWIADKIPEPPAWLNETIEEWVLFVFIVLMVGGCGSLVVVAIFFE